jgi:hypothetical protein
MKDEVREIFSSRWNGSGLGSEPVWGACTVTARVIRAGVTGGSRRPAHRDQFGRPTVTGLTGTDPATRSLSPAPKGQMILLGVATTPTDVRGTMGVSTFKSCQSESRSVEFDNNTDWRSSNATNPIQSSTYHECQ